MNDNRTETDDRSDTQSLDARRRRFEEDLVDAYDEELEMELDDRRFDDGEELLFSQERREARKQ
ncbi:polyphosphate kinase 2, partial [Burkholderia multivorans]